ncbi:hypothetical protein DL93DRAFT_2074535 [Clavulina sp. PMI_390]|nr:hypothetical protein DL93DRAFT_2074535 [Clavulina sp. PMI_390]
MSFSTRLHNTRAPIHSLPNELLSEVSRFNCQSERTPSDNLPQIMMHGWDRQQTQAKREEYRSTVSSVSSIWNSLVVTDPRLWTYINVSDAEHPISSADEERIMTILQRGASLPIHIRLHCSEKFAERGALRLLRRVIAPEQLARCETLHVSTTSAAVWNEIFPLPKNMPLLRELRVDSCLNGSIAWDPSEEDCAWAGVQDRLFEEVPRLLEHLELNIDHLHSSHHDWMLRLPLAAPLSPNSGLLSHIIPSQLRTLSLRVQMPHPEALSFVQACSALESLELELRNQSVDNFLFTDGGAIRGWHSDEVVEIGEDDQLDDAVPPPRETYTNGISLPSLRSLRLRGASATMLSAIISAPDLTRLHFNLDNEEEAFAVSYALIAASVPSAGSMDDLEGLEFAVLGMGSPLQPTLDQSDLDFLHHRSSSPSGSSTSSHDSQVVGHNAYPHLKELVITGDYIMSAPSDAIADFVSASTMVRRNLSTIQISDFANLPEVLETIAMIGGPPFDSEIAPSLSSSPSASSTLSSLSDFSSHSHAIPPSLTSINIVESSQQAYPPLHEVASSLETLLRSHSDLHATWMHSAGKKTSGEHSWPRSSLRREMHEDVRSRVLDVFAGL